jgi:hypothetical protein
MKEKKAGVGVKKTVILEEKSISKRTGGRRGIYEGCWTDHDTYSSATADGGGGEHGLG